MPADPAQLIVGGIVGFGSAGILRWWQYRRDLWIGRVQMFFSVLSDAADTATSYWVVAKGGPPEAEGVDAQSYAKSLKDFTDEKAAVEELEARLFGLQMRLDGLLASFVERLSKEDQSALKNHMNVFSDAICGGEFMSRTRDADPNRARASQAAASQLIVSVSAAADSALTIRGYWRHVQENCIVRPEPK